MKNDKFRRRLKVTRTNKEDTGMLQLKYRKRQQVPSVAARLLG